MAFDPKQIKQDIWEKGVQIGFISKDTIKPRRVEDKLSEILFETLVSKRIDASNIPLYFPEFKDSEKEDILLDSGKKLSDIVKINENFQCQYSIIAAGSEHAGNWDDTPENKKAPWPAPTEDGKIVDGYIGYEYGDFHTLQPDFVYYDNSESNNGVFSIIENKIGAEETYHPESGKINNHKSAQFARYADWLVYSQQNKNCSERNFAILTSIHFIMKKPYGWYYSELRNVLNYEVNGIKRKENVNGYLMCWEDIFQPINKCY